MNKIYIFVVFCFGSRSVTTASIPSCIRDKILAFTCLFITRFKSYTKSLNTEFELSISLYIWL